MELGMRLIKNIYSRTTNIYLHGRWAFYIFEVF